MVAVDTSHSDKAVNKQIADHKPKVEGGQANAPLREKVHKEQTEEKQACPLSCPPSLLSQSLFVILPLARRFSTPFASLS